MAVAGIPSSTYRLQISAEFTLNQAAELTGYLAALGVGAVYVSPLLQATAGSTHGYDVVDHAAIDAARGGAAGLKALAEACRAHGLGLVVDIVPNHMGVADASQNAAWWDLLKFGQESRFESWFDIDWSYGNGKILIPVLADDFDADRDLKVLLSDTDRGGELRYFEHRFPLAPGSYAQERNGELAGRTDRRAESPSEVHRRQHYELISFRRADTDQNYRRFFAVTDLAGLRVEDDSVFDATHALLLDWVRDRAVTGIRVDHPDGLTDPGGYLTRLACAAPEAWITVEKITEPGESLPTSWPVAGMTGYDALAEVNGLLVDPAAEAAFSEIYVQLTGDTRDWATHIADGKTTVASTILRAEIRRLVRVFLNSAAPEDGRAGEAAIEAALIELVAAFGVYRSYLPLGLEHLQAAAALARRRRPDLSASIDALWPRLCDPSDELCSRFQQVTGAVMAKGVEDTAYYRYNRLVGLNEVGGYPGTFGSSVLDFHTAQRRRLAHASHAMTTLSTHDTKRGEDVRARLAVLPELPHRWREVADELLRLAPVPNRAFGYLLWQTLVAADPIERARMHAYAEKAMREAADGTGWIDPDLGFEAAVHAAVDSAYEDAAVVALISSLAREIDQYGWSNSLSQKLIQLTMPGIPDVYQGSELWENSLVDPDNRRPVDFELRTALLASVDDGFPSTAAQSPVESSAKAKFWLVRQALHARKYRSELFTDYRPLPLAGVAEDHLVAFDRGGAITLATRLPVSLQRRGGWGAATISLPAGRYRDSLTAVECTGTVEIGEVLSRYPVALLLAADS